jgi:hypothetical protein
MFVPFVNAHSHEFHAASDSPRAEQCIVDAAKAMAMTGVDLLSDRMLLTAVREELTAGAGKAS